ncbi:MAG TPA: ATP-binding protein [Chloroflexota bacterium]
MDGTMPGGVRSPDANTSHDAQLRVPSLSRLKPQGVRAMLVLLILSILIPLLLVQSGIYVSWFQARSRAEMQSNLEVARAVANSFDAFVDDIQSQELALGLAFTLPSQSAADLSYGLVDNAKLYPAVRQFSWAGLDGRVLASSLPASVGTDVGGRPFFQQILAGREWVVSDLFVKAPGTDPLIVIARGIKDRSGVMRGVILAEIEPARIQTSLGIDRVGGGSVSLVDHHGRLVYQYPKMPSAWDARDWTSRDPTFLRALAGEEVMAQVSLPGEPEEFAGRVPIKSLGWAAGASRPVGESTGPIARDLAGYAALSALSAVVVLFAAVAVSRRLTRPIDRLRAYAVAVGRGYPAGRVEPTGPQELVDLANALDGMAEDIRVRERGLRRRGEAMAFLAEAGDQLSASLDYQTTISLLAGLVVPRLAEWCLVDMVADGRNPRRVVAVHADPAKRHVVAELRRNPPSHDDDGPCGRVLRTGEAELIARVDDPEGVAAGSKSACGRAISALAPKSIMVVPIQLRGHTAGTVLFGASSEERCFDQDDLALARLLARRAALALDNARLYGAAQDAVESRDEFLSVAAHELKTPITSLRGFAQLTLRQLAKRGDVPPDRLKQAVDVIESQSGKLSQLVNQLLDVSRLESGRLTLNRVETDLSQLIAGVVATLEPASDEHRFIFSGPDSLTANVDPLRLEQVITNLLDNALKFSPRGGDITVTLESRPDDFVRISVRDHGVGIPPDRLPHVFDRFYQAHTNGYYGGMGLGLYISREIAILHGGEIHAESPAEGGTRIVVSLPRESTSGAQTSDMVKQKS